MADRKARIGIDARRVQDGGIGRYIASLVRLLPAEAPDFEFVVFGNAHQQGVLLSLSRDIEFQSIWSTGYNPLGDLELRRGVRAAGVDLLHVPHYVVPPRPPTRLVVTVHDLIHWLFPRTPFHARYCEHMLGRVRRDADMVLAVSEAGERDLVKIAKLPEDRIRVVPNGVDSLFSEPPSEEETGNFLHRLRLAGPYALNVTNGLPHKGLDVLAAAMRQIRGLQLIIIGQGADRPAVYETLARAGVSEERVRVIGSVSEREMRILYSGARIAVVSSLYEGFGLPALEAMAAGVPVVATRAGGLPEVVGSAGRLVEPGSIAPLAQAIYTLAFETGDAERAAIIDAGRAHAASFSWVRTARLTAAAYRRVLEG